MRSPIPITKQTGRTRISQSNQDKDYLSAAVHVAIMAERSLITMASRYRTISRNGESRIILASGPTTLKVAMSPAAVLGK